MVILRVWLYLWTTRGAFTVCLPCHSETYITYAKIWMEKTEQFFMHFYISFFINKVGNIRILTFDLKDTQQYGTKFLGPHFNFPIGQKWCVMRRVRLDNLNNKCWHVNVCCQIQTNTLLTASAIYFWNSTCNYCRLVSRARAKKNMYYIYPSKICIIYTLLKYVLYIPF